MKNTISRPLLRHPGLDAVLHCLRKYPLGRIEAALLLGSGLSGVADRAAVELDLPYREIDGYPATKIPGHPGRLIAGELGGKRCLIFVGRFHCYEGADGATVTLPVQVAAACGARTMVLSNSVGGLNREYQTGDLILVEDHLNLMGLNPLVDMIRHYEGNPFAAEGPSPFVNLNGAYRTDFFASLRETVNAKNIRLHKGMLAAVLGPNYETAGEVKMLRNLGADAVCMSTVPETIYARYAGLEVATLSFVANMADDGSKTGGLDHKEVLSSAAAGAENFAFAMQELVRRL